MTAHRYTEWRASGPCTTSNVSKADLVQKTRLYLQTYAKTQDVRATYQALIAGALAQRARQTRESIRKIIQSTGASAEGRFAGRRGVEQERHRQSHRRPRLLAQRRAPLGACRQAAQVRVDGRERAQKPGLDRSRAGARGGTAQVGRVTEGSTGLVRCIDQLP